ncbi:MAG: hypothetical protein CXT67_05845 [Methanobacteriota archaeon]|jgi:hypothetical protein|nr:MAG: hypothetical protein CXT67_05845 [Euryarchaeota archaeon]HIG19205.1 hypothetical protein [Candidatus Poseidoniales archaeon]
MAGIDEGYVSGHESSESEHTSSDDPLEIDNIEEPKFGLRELLATLMDLKTLPHILLLLILSIILYALAQGPDSANLYSAIGFISLSFGYSLTAISTRWDFAHRLVRVEGLASDSWFKSMLFNSLKAWSLPLLLSTIICFGLLQLIKGDDNWKTWIPLSLASLFLLWSIGQGLSFKSGTASWLSNGKKVLDDTSRESNVIGISAWQILAVATVAVLIGYAYSSGFQGETNEKLKWIGFIILAITVQVAMIYWIKDTLIDVSATKGGARFAARWGMISQIFVTWHLASAWRRLIDEPSAFTMVIEEFTLMVITVLLAIWSLASRDVNRGGKLFTSENALFWGLAFGFGYAGSIAMITNLSDSLGGGNIATTMAIGHLVTALTIIMIHSKTLRSHKIRILNPPQVMTQKVDNIETPITEVTEVEEEPEVDEPETQEQVIDLDDLELSDDVVELMD